MRFDVLEKLLTPLEHMPQACQFFDFLTTGDSCAIPVSAYEYHLVSFRGLCMCKLLRRSSCKLCHSQSVLSVWTHSGGSTGFLLRRPACLGEDTRVSVRTLLPPYHISVLIENTPEHGQEAKTSVMMANLIPLAIKDVLKVQSNECRMLASCTTSRHTGSA